MTHIGHRLLALAAGLGLALTGSVHAHLPHDAIFEVVVSPDFENDQAALIYAQLTDHSVLGRTTDGGQTWTIYGAPFLGIGRPHLTMSPDFGADQTVFAANGEAGLWRSTDGGVIWSQVNAGLTTLQTFAVAFSPDYASDGRLLAATSDGVFRSDDGGDSWILASTGLGETAILRLAFAPDDPDVVFAGAALLHRSDDGGLSWQVKQILPHPLESLSVSPSFSTDGTLAVSFGRVGGGVLVSLDGGNTVVTANDGLADMAVNVVVITDDGTTYAVATVGGCHRAATPGGMWTSFTEGFAAPAGQANNHYLAVAPSPGLARDGILFVGAYEGLYRSDDDGVTWTELDTYGVGLIRRLALSPTFATDGLLFAGDYGGGPWRYRSPTLSAYAGGPGPGTGLGTGPGAGAGAPTPAAGHRRGSPSTPPAPPSRWTNLAIDVDDLYAGEIAVSPGFAGDRTLFYGFENLWRSVDAGASWTPLGSPVPFIRSLELSPGFPGDPTIFIGASLVGNFLSQDGGESWKPLRGGFPEDASVTAADFSPTWTMDGTLFVSSRNSGLWRTQDTGATWQDVTPGSPDTRIRTVELSPSFASDGIVICGTIADGVFRSETFGDSWAQANAGLPSGDLGTIEDFAFSPAFSDDSIVFVASGSDGMYRSSDGGQSWQAADGGFAMEMPRHIAISPDFPRDETLFVSSHSWIWESTDAGDHWTSLPGYARVDESHPTVQHEGTWLEVVLPGSHGGSVSTASAAGTSSELTFYGNSLRWHAAKDVDGGFADVLLDGIPTASVDLYAPVASPSEPVFTATFGANGWHTVRIVVTGTAPPGSTGTVIRNDGFESTF